MLAGKLYVSVCYIIGQVLNLNLIGKSRNLFHILSDFQVHEYYRASDIFVKNIFLLPDLVVYSVYEVFFVIILTVSNLQESGHHLLVLSGPADKLE